MGLVVMFAAGLLPGRRTIERDPGARGHGDRRYALRHRMIASITRRVS